MTLYQKVNAVLRLFKLLDKEISHFKSVTHMGCIAGCGKCCEKPDIFASPLEFLPWAYHTFKAGKADLWMAKFENESIPPVCYLYSNLTIKGSGYCTDYFNRGMICRLFGFAAMKNKEGKKLLVTCSFIKHEKEEIYRNAVTAIKSGLRVPVFSNYYDQLRNIDRDLTNTMLPVNKAMFEALKTVCAYYAYRRPPRRKAA